MNAQARTVRRHASAQTRIIARDLRLAARKRRVTCSSLRSLERLHGLPAGRLFLALAGIRPTIAEVLILQTAFGMSIASVFAGTGTKDVAA
jgi:hypothetical protein